MSIQYHDDEDTIEHAPHDAENPYTMILNSLTRDESISPNCRWLVTYLLTNTKNWKINVKQVVNHLKPHMGRDKVYKIFDEAIEAGYIKREIIKVKMPSGGCVKRLKYYVSENKFKKCYRHPEIQDAGDQNAGNTDDKERLNTKKNHYKENHCLVLGDGGVEPPSSGSVTPPHKGKSLEKKSSQKQKQIPAEDCDTGNSELETVTYMDVHGNSKTIRINDIYAMSVKFDWKEDEIEMAVKILAKYEKGVRHLDKFIDRVIKRKRNDEIQKSQPKEKKPCKQTTQQPKTETLPKEIQELKDRLEIIKKQTKDKGLSINDLHNGKNITQQDRNHLSEHDSLARAYLNSLYQWNNRNKSTDT